MGLQDPFCLSSSTVSGSDSPAKLLSYFHQGEGSAGGDRGVNPQRGSRAGPFISGVLQSPVCSAEAIRCVEACNRFVGSQQVRQTDEIQNGIQPIFSMSGTKIRLDDFDRFKGCLPPSTHASRQSEISSFHGGRQHLSISRPMFRPFHGTTGVYKGHGSRVGHGAQLWDSYVTLSRRLVSARPFPSGGDSGKGRSSSFMLSTRNCGKSGKILSVSVSDSHLSRDGRNKSVFEGFPDGETSRCSLETDRRIFIFQKAKHRYLEMSAGSLVVPVSCSSSGTTENAILTTSASSKLGFCGRGRPGSVELSDKIEPSVAVRCSTPSGRGVSSDSPTRPALLVRHLGPGLGGPSFRPLCFGPVVTKGATSFHQYLGTSSYQTGPTGISTSHRGAHNRYICGQHYCLSICEKTGRNDLRVPELRGSASPSVVTDSLSRKNQVIGSEWTLVHEVVDELLQRWLANLDLFATSLNYRIPVYFSPINNLMAAGTDAFLQSWDDLSAYGFPPFALIREVIRKLLLSRNTY